jgi:hypothetical protein
MGTDENTRLRDFSQQRIQAVAATPAFDRIAPDEDDIDVPQLCCYFVCEVIVVDGRLCLDSSRRERGEQRREATLGWVAALTRRSIAGIWHGHRTRSCCIHDAAPVLSSWLIAVCGPQRHASIPRTMNCASTVGKFHQQMPRRPTSASM